MLDSGTLAAERTQKHAEIPKFTKSKYKYIKLDQINKMGHGKINFNTNDDVPELYRSVLCNMASSSYILEE
ncbi:jg22336 [Pararge aegeria aegeria]|uniref:Jg22336 protein n=1 Tax=Pararge aegeria aegeria TaxID=348720 RepID=A0A8S4S4S2_9NEOP|nr:jg22336 [Pararge aegeria aegeria]